MSSGPMKTRQHIASRRLQVYGMCSNLLLLNQRADSGSVLILLPFRNILSVMLSNREKRGGAHRQLNKGNANSCASANTAVRLFVSEHLGQPSNQSCHKGQLELC